MRVMAAGRLAALLGEFDREPAYKGLAEALRVVITDGRIPVGMRLPSERELTQALSVSRTTVTRAYAELRENEFIVSRQGSGSVAALPSDRGLRGDHLLPPGRDVGEDHIDLTCAAPAPGPGLLAAYERAVRELPAHLSGSGYFPSGLPQLREAVAQHYAARGLPTDPEQILIVPGALAGVTVAARTLARRGSRTLVESPTYPNAIATLRASGARLVGAEVDREHASIAGAVATLRQLQPSLAYLVPDFHNPTGHLLGDDGRAELSQALALADCTSIVDESMVLLALDGQSMPLPFAAHCPEAVSVGSLSKPFWGGLRVGWLRAPSRRVDDFFRARLSLDLGVPVLEQLVAADLLVTGDPLVVHRRAQLRTSRDAAVAALSEHLPEWKVRSPGGGLTLWCELPDALSSALVPKAREHGVLVAPGPSFAPEGGLDRFLRLPISAPAHVLTDAVARLALAWAETADASGRPGRRPASLEPSTPLVA